ncbi:hypothetical protein ZWY2020_019866 [Hordeum vulgare]|nr:hypothetical protein ZWY2020_019866 [Hordeum vulgare]
MPGGPCAVHRVPPAPARRRRHHQGAGQGQGRTQAACRRRRPKPPPRLLARPRRRRAAATGWYNYRGASASAVLAHLADGNSLHTEDEEEDDADLEVAAPRGISDMYDLIIGLEAAPGGQEDDPDGTTAAADTDKIEEQDAEITEDVDEDEGDNDAGFCVVRGITITLEFSDGGEDWIVV